MSVIFPHKLEDIVNVLFLISTSKNVAYILEYSCAKVILRCVLLALSRKVINVSVPCG